jgi:hypothetical protein
MPAETDPDGKLHTLSQLEDIIRNVLPEAERLLSVAKGELNVDAAKKRLRMMRLIAFNLYTSCVKLGLKDDADCLQYGGVSPTLEAYRKMIMIQKLSSR